MPRELSWIPTLVLFVVLAPIASAVTVIVPDDYPTIQAAIDAGVDVIQVRAGLVPERLTISRPVTIEAGPHPPYSWSWAPVPMVQSLEVTGEGGGGGFPAGFTVRGLRFLGDVKMLIRPHGYLFESCRFDSGFTDVAIHAMAGEMVSVRNCLFLGDARVTGAVQFVGNTVIGGSARIFSDGSHDISHNYITGPAEVGLELHLDASYGPISRNTVRNTGDGIRFIPSNLGGWGVTHNDVADCTGDGIVYRTSADGYVGVYCDSNLIEDCGGAGIAVRPAQGNDGFHGAWLSGNSIRRSAQEGVRLENTIAHLARGNVILDSGGDGFSVSTAGRFEGNVIGRSGGAGLRISVESRRVTGNTFFSNAGAGIHVENAYPGDTLAHNISAFNGGPGLLLTSGTPPLMACNDWFANVGGMTVGVSPDYSDISINPRFCDLGAGDVRLSASSPLLDDPNCGLIGALGQGCEATTGVDEILTRESENLHAWPVPSQGAVRFSLPPASGTTSIEVYDVTGARRWQAALPGGTKDVAWDRRDSGGQPVAPGVYFARLRRGDIELARVRVVLTE